MSERLTQDNLTEVLLRRVPELKAVAEQWLSSESPFWLVTNAAPFAQKLAREALNQGASRPTAVDTLRRLFDVLEEMHASDDTYVQACVTTGFEESLDPADPNYNYLLSFMGPATRESVLAWFGQSQQTGTSQADGN